MLYIILFHSPLKLHSCSLSLSLRIWLIKPVSYLLM